MLSLIPFLVSIIRDIKCVLWITFWTFTRKVKFDKPIIINPQGNSAPILLVHGSSGNQSEWLHAIHHVEKTFPEHPIYAFSLDLEYANGYQINGDSYWTTLEVKRLAKAHNWTIQKYAQELEKRVRELNIKKPILIGHSMGGLICAEYERMTQNAQCVIAFSSPFQGAPLLKHLCISGVRHEQMTPGSEYLLELNEKLKNRPGYLTIGSPQDYQVPNKYAKIEGVTHWEVSGYNHFSITTHELTWIRIHRWVNGMSYFSELEKKEYVWRMFISLTESFSAKTSFLVFGIGVVAAFVFDLHVICWVGVLYGVHVLASFAPPYLYWPFNVALIWLIK